MNAQMRMPGSGSRVRSQSRRRFIVAAEDRFEPGEPWIVRRSDSVEVAKAESVKARSKHINSQVVVFDRVSGEVV